MSMSEICRSKYIILSASHWQAGVTQPTASAGAASIAEESYHCEERSAVVAEYEECADAAPRQISARMPKRRSGQILGVVIVVASTMTVAP